MILNDSAFSTALTDPNAAASQQAILQQQLSILAYSPYGDSPLFRNQLADPKKKEEVCSEIKTLKRLMLFHNEDLSPRCKPSLLVLNNILFSFVVTAFKANKSNSPEGSYHTHSL